MGGFFSRWLSPPSCSSGSASGSEGGAAWGLHGETRSPDACFRVRGLRCVCPQERSPSPAGPAHREPVPSLRSGGRQRVAAGAAFGCCKRTSASANTERACSVPALDLAGAPSAHPWFQSDVNGQTGRAGGADVFRCSAQVKVGTPHRWGSQASARGTLGGTGGAEAFLNTVVSKITQQKLCGANPPAGHLRSLGGPCPVAFAASGIYHRAVPLLGTCPERCARAVAHGRAPLPARPHGLCLSAGGDAPRGNSPCEEAGFGLGAPCRAGGSAADTPAPCGRRSPAGWMEPP